MTREEAIHALCSYGIPQNEEIFQQALNLAIEALSEPSIVRCKDCRFWKNEHLSRTLLFAERKERGKRGRGMTKIKLTNPYWDKVYEVEESAEYIKRSLNNVVRGNESFIVLTTKNGALGLSPSNIATFEVLGGEDE